MECSHCGAGLAPNVPRCPYCGTFTPAGRQIEQASTEAARQREAAARAEAARLRAEATASAGRTGVIALVLSIAGLACCVPSSIVAIAMGLRARSLAAKHDGPAPASATAALVLGTVGVLLTCGVGASIARDAERRDARQGELARQLATGVDSPTLDGSIACALVEARILADGYDGTGGLSIDGFECLGRVEQHAEIARLEGVSFTPGARPRVTVSACLERGARWTVAAIGPDVTCAPVK